MQSAMIIVMAMGFVFQTYATTIAARNTNSLDLNLGGVPDGNDWSENHSREGSLLEQECRVLSRRPIQNQRQVPGRLPVGWNEVPKEVSIRA